jgi:hypothetical protein
MKSIVLPISFDNAITKRYVDVVHGPVRRGLVLD